MSRELLRRRSRAACLLAALALLLTLGVQAGAGSGARSRTVRELVGQRLVVAMEGTAPSTRLLERIRAGEVGGVILFGPNVRTVSQLRSLTRELRVAAKAAGRPPLLVAVDQEGGAFRRLRWAPPGLSASALGHLSDAQVARSGTAAGRSLRASGINLDLAPVADVPSNRASFIATQERAYATDASRAAAKAAAFARGLRAAGVAATAKHFPGLGRATISTDLAPVTIRASRAQLDADLVPFRRLVAEGVPLVMLSNAIYTAFGSQPAAWSPAVHAFLRRDLGFGGVTITDALEAVASAQRRSVAAVAVLAARAGADLLLLAGGEQESAYVFDELVAGARHGRVSRASLARSYQRITTLKRRLTAPA